MQFLLGGNGELTALTADYVMQFGDLSRLSIMRCYTSHKWLIDCNFLTPVLGIL